MNETLEPIPDYIAEGLSHSTQGRWYLKHGQTVKICSTRRGRWGLGKCHSNAGWLARRWPHRYEWWTGYAVLTPGGWYDNHSWVRVSDGEFLEVTYSEPAEVYLGVPVPGEALLLVGACGNHPNDCMALHGGHPSRAVAEALTKRPMNETLEPVFVFDSGRIVAAD